ncbi:TetR/AcrR family transcriptional regulator [Psychrobacillus antarcticus]|uniref:TetR/AcrR family transcriptional regulator n=1 Tax=Psychrobacillus antarcticus TaxID=2879115 RepID=UPI0024084E98|nr:TetR/AcrR family transcriptional regulator [Psychrobacillus antarcticus]
MGKKQLIMEKAIELFAQQGFELTSVQQITEHCGISKGAFYLSFKSKDELILAIIDQFMSQMISDTDYQVTNTQEDERTLYKFYFTIFKSSQKHSNFAKILMKEQSQSFNKELGIKFRYYDRLLEKIILTMMERLFGEKIENTKHDLVYCIKGFISIYSELILFNDVPVNLDLLAQSLVEKTNLLASQITIPFVTEEIFQLKRLTNDEVTIEQLLAILDQCLNEAEEPLEKESLSLLKQHLLEPSLSPALVEGLLKNVHDYSNCKWVAFLLRNYFELSSDK